MGKLTYGMMMSLGGFVADPSSQFDDDVLAFINDEMRRSGPEIYGRRMHEARVFWETYDEQKSGRATQANSPVSGRDWASWSFRRRWTGP
ncbi:hypothetical protein [Pelagibacterium sp. H642]|uniref:hypothetical protein n=1 Tax=Pelagibacterium sp. H642 TaxID=1881069 RepID=UPI002816195E|nr:hypothetical protein [Pelagibacterium sp. H642]WMT92678.1 hypothetical protein NO934_20285 [Pelagibacterium sp. H642]